MNLAIRPLRQRQRNIRQKRSFLLVSLLVLSLLFSFSGQAKVRQSGKQAQKLEQAYKQLKTASSRQASRQKFLDAFPKDAKNFKRCFVQTNRYPKLEISRYLVEVELMLNAYPSKVMKLLLGLAGKLKLDSEAAEHLQLLLAKTSLNYSTFFVQEFKRMSAERRRNAVEFLVSGRRGPAPGYHSLIVLLERVGHKDIAEQLRAGLG